MRQIFVSFAYQDVEYRDRICKWADKGLLGRVEIMSEADDVRQLGDAVVRAQLATMLQGAAALVVLVGDVVHDRPWVDYEVDNVQSSRRPIIVVRVPGTTGAAPRSVRHLPEVAFDPSAIKAAIERALGT